MPELPEVETIKNDLVSVLVGRRVIGFSCIKPRLLSRGTVKQFKSKLLKAKILSVNRRAKLILIELSSGYILVIHLKMTGQLVWQSASGRVRGGGHPIKSVNIVPNKYTYITLSLSGGKLYFNDVRQFGYWQLIKKSALGNHLNKYGPEPLAKDFSLDKFRDNLLKHKKTNIKSALLNQAVVAGLGNIYVDESLFVAKILPQRIISKLKLSELRSLHSAIVKVLKKAVASRGTSFNTYIDAQGKSGSYWHKRFVYGRSGRACLNCGRAVKKTTLAGRGTHYCAFCQR